MTELIAIEFITGLIKMFLKLIPAILITLTIFKLLRYASGWQSREHDHKVFKVS